MARTPPAREPLSFAQQLDRLEEIVRRLEAQELDLDEALKLFEEGIERLREARGRLTAAEGKEEWRSSPPLSRSCTRIRWFTTTPPAWTTTICVAAGPPPTAHSMSGPPQWPVTTWWPSEPGCWTPAWPHSLSSHPAAGRSLSSCSARPAPGA